MAARTRAGAQWRHHERSGRTGTFVLFAAALALLGMSVLLWGTSGAAIVGTVCALPLAAILAFAVYAMGPSSGWAGLWTIRVYRDADDVARRVAAALGNAGRPAPRAPDRAPSRWLRITGPPNGAPLELADGTRVWFLPAEADVKGRPETRIVLEPPFRPDPVEVEFLKATVLAAMQPGYAAKEG